MAKKLEYTWQNAPQLALRFITSFGLAAIVLALMTILTLFGTLNQKEEGLYLSQKVYFESFFVSDKVFGMPIILPGGYLLMTILFFNVLAGTLVKLRRNWKTVGLFLAHIGILYMILASFVTRHFAWEGYMAMYPGEQSNRVSAHHDWQVEIIPLDKEGKASEALVIPYEAFRDVRKGKGKPRTFKSEEIPFDFVVEHYEPNANPLPSTLPVAQGKGFREVDGHVLYPMQRAKTNEKNIPGFYAKIVPESGDPIEAIIGGHTGMNRNREFIPPRPLTIEVAGNTYNIQFQQRQFVVPFDIKVDEFHVDFHPGTGKASNYQSDVTKIETLSDGSKIEERVKIWMNHPLRYQGYTFFQSSFGTNLEGEHYTQFTVWNNPADHWPLYSLWVIGIGLAVHFVIKLNDHLSRSSRSKTSKA
tara:strand:+ start:4223 stop:5470 length:1248 start_codon:yes stop_codon:yes gene_type:complete